MQQDEGNWWRESRVQPTRIALLNGYPDRPSTAVTTTVCTPSGTLDTSNTIDVLFTIVASRAPSSSVTLNVVAGPADAHSTRSAFVCAANGDEM